MHAVPSSTNTDFNFNFQFVDFYWKLTPTELTNKKRTIAIGAAVRIFKHFHKPIWIALEANKRFVVPNNKTIIIELKCVKKFKLPTNIYIRSHTCREMPSTERSNAYSSFTLISDNLWFEWCTLPYQNRSAISKFNCTSQRLLITNKHFDYWPKVSKTKTNSHVNKYWLLWFPWCFAWKRG